MEKLKRETYVDVFKGICMFFVILHHVPGISENWQIIYRPFFLAGFFFISGFFFINSRMHVSFFQKGINIFTSLFLPYLIYVFFVTFVLSVVSKDVHFLPLCLETIMVGRKMWFICVIILLEVFCWIFIFGPTMGGKKNIWIIYVSPILSILFFFMIPQAEYIWYFNITFFAGFYFCIGIIVSYYGYIFKRIIKSNSFGGVCFILYIIMLFVDKYYIKQEGAFNHSLSNYPFFLMQSMTSIVGLLWFSSKWVILNKGVAFVGKYSLLYYFFQYKMILLISHLFNRWGINTGNWIQPILISLSVILISSPVVYLVGRYFPVLAGKFRYTI